jgi:DUF971 family protein
MPPISKEPHELRDTRGLREAPTARVLSPSRRVLTHGAGAKELSRCRGNVDLVVVRLLENLAGLWALNDVP